MPELILCRAMESTGAEGRTAAISQTAMWMTLAAMTLSNSPIFSRRSRWVSSNVGRTPGVTRHPPPEISSS